MLTALIFGRWRARLRWRGLRILTIGRPLRLRASLGEIG
jgi:hypothetical protein